MIPLPMEIVYFWGVILALCVVALAILTGIAAHHNKIDREQEEAERRERMNKFARTVISVDGYRPAPLPKTLTREYIEKANADLERMQGRNK